MVSISQDIAENTCSRPGLISFESMPCLDNASITLDGDLGGEYNVEVVTGLHNLANARMLQLLGDDAIKFALSVIRDDYFKRSIIRQVYIFFSPKINNSCQCVKEIGHASMLLTLSLH